MNPNAFVFMIIFSFGLGCLFFAIDLENKSNAIKLFRAAAIAVFWGLSCYFIGLALFDDHQFDRSICRLGIVLCVSTGSILGAIFGTAGLNFGVK